MVSEIEGALAKTCHSQNYRTKAAQLGTLGTLSITVVTDSSQAPAERRAICCQKCQVAQTRIMTTLMMLTVMVDRVSVVVSVAEVVPAVASVALMVTVAKPQGVLLHQSEEMAYKLLPVSSHLAKTARVTGAILSKEYQEKLAANPAIRMTTPMRFRGSQVITAHKIKLQSACLMVSTEVRGVRADKVSVRAPWIMRHLLWQVQTVSTTPPRRSKSSLTTTMRTRVLTVTARNSLVAPAAHPS